MLDTNRSSGFALALLLLAATPALGEKSPARPPRPSTGNPTLADPATAERARHLEKARAEIEKNPRQKKFILFRYGLQESDLK
jgi:hypothetical protein